MSRPNILIAGCGPAGALAAAELLRLGNGATIISGPRRRPLMNGLSQRCLQSLEYHGFSEALALCTEQARRTAFWGGEVSAPNAEYIVDRGRFDAALAADIERMGARIIKSQARTISAGEDAARIIYRGGSLSADFIIDARGRRGSLGPGGRSVRGPATIALTKALHNCNTDPCTAVGSFAEGGWWMAASGTGRGLVQYYVDAERQDLRGRSGLETAFTNCAAMVKDLAKVLPAGAATHGNAWAFDTTAMLTADLLEPRLIRCGDAAHTFDPLSGHGIYQAIGSGLAAAATVNTCLHRPENAEMARTFYEQRSIDSFMHFARVGRDFYRSEGQWPDAPYWRARCEWPDDDPADEGAAITEPIVRKTNVVVDGIVCEREVIVTADNPRGIRLVANVPVPELLARIREAGRPADPAEWAGDFVVTPDEMGVALRWLEQHGLIGP